MATFVSLISGSSGNATFVSDGKTNLLIDCGMSGAKLKESLHAIDVMPESIDALLITHEHVDHTKGAILTFLKLIKPADKSQAGLYF